MTWTVFTASFPFGALALEKLPDRLVTIDRGAIGAERAIIYHALGSTVTIVGPQDDILPPIGRGIATMLAAGPRATGELGLDAARIANQRGNITVDAQQRSNPPNIYAIGDCTSGTMLTQVASTHGE